MEEDGVAQGESEYKHQIPVEFIQEKALVFSIKEKMETISHSHCISKVPDENLEGKEEKYHPALVSIGPFHHGKEALKGMEDHKWRYLNTLVSRKSDVESTLLSCLQILRKSEETARKCYGGGVHMESGKFMQVLLLDACFIIELFLAYAVKGLRRRDDPCYGSNERFFHIRSDLILLENQIPFFILQQLFQVVPLPRQCNYSLTELALRFFRKLIPKSKETPQERVIGSANILHILDLIRQFHLPTNLESPSRVWQRNLKNATDLQAAGINLKKAKAESLMNLEFSDGVFRIPQLWIHNYTETLFRNFIALEQSCRQYTKHVTSYAFLMKSLVKTKTDVKLLKRRGILDFGSDDKQDEVINLFRCLQADVNLEDFYYRGLCEKINGHRNIKLQVVALCCK